MINGMYYIGNSFLLVTRLCPLLDGVVLQNIAFYSIAFDRNDWVKLIMKIKRSQYDKKWGSSSFTLSKLECSKQPVKGIEYISMG